jgi:hypothetical protein
MRSQRGSTTIGVPQEWRGSNRNHIGRAVIGAPDALSTISTENSATALGNVMKIRTAHLALAAAIGLSLAATPALAQAGKGIERLYVL